jgi:hypothetical protein
MSYLCAFGKQQEEIIRWWPLYLDDQDCVGKVQLCVNVSMISNNHGTKKVCYRFSKKKVCSPFLFAFQQQGGPCTSLHQSNVLTYLIIDIMTIIDAARWSGCGYYHI